jgi:DNA mismatch repair protein MutS
MALDVQTQNNLELFRSSRTGKSEGSLLSVIDLTRTSMGGRLLRKWLGQPILELKELTSRQDAIEWFLKENQPLPCGWSVKRDSDLETDQPD